MCCCNNEPDTYHRDKHARGVIEGAAEAVEDASRSLQGALDALRGYTDYRAASQAIQEAHTRLSVATHQANRAASLMDESMSLAGWL